MAGQSTRSSLTGSDHGFRRQRARSPRQSRARASPPPFPLRTMARRARPATAPFDVRAAIDKIGQDVLSAGTVRDSLRDLLRHGPDGRGGLDRLADKIRKLRAQARRRGDLGGTLDQVRAALDQALATERDTLASSDTEMRDWRSWNWRRCPTTLPARSGLSTTTRGDPTRHVPSSRRSRHAAA